MTCQRGNGIRLAVATGALALASLMALVGGQSSAATQDAPEDYYFQSIANAKQHVREFPFYSFDYEFVQKHNDDVTKDRLRVVENTATRVVDETVLGDSSKHFVVVPDLFGDRATHISSSIDQLQLGSDIPQATAGDSGLRTLGTVSARYTNYAITMDDDNVSSSCGSAVRLNLNPRNGADPYKYNLRSLTIVKSTMMICNATAVWKVGSLLGHSFPVLFDLAIDQDTGLVTGWTASGTAHAAFLTYKYELDGTYTNLVASDHI